MSWETHSDQDLWKILAGAAEAIADAVVDGREPEPLFIATFREARDELDRRSAEVQAMISACQ